MRTLAFGATAASLLLAACGGGSVPSIEPTRESGQSGLMGQTLAGKCSPETHERPFVVEWDATDMSSFQARATSDVLVVKYEGCKLTVLDSCTNDSIRGSLGAYKAIEWTSGGLEKIDIASAGELYAKLPLGVSSLEGRVKAGEKFHMEYFVSGTRSATRPAIFKNDIAKIPGCRGATHFVYAYNIGAFALGSVSGASAEAQGSSMFGFGMNASGKAATGRAAEKKGGDLATCTGATARELETCKVPIRLTLRAIEDGENPDVSASKGPVGADATNLVGKMMAENAASGAAGEHRQAAMKKFQAGDGKGCIAEMDAADHADPVPSHASTNPAGMLRIRGLCLMLAGQCEAGKRLDRTALQATMSSMAPALIDNIVEGDAGQKCQGAVSGPRDEALRAANEIYRSTTGVVPPDVCLKAYATLKRVGPKVQKDGPNDSNYGMIERAPKLAPRCLGSSGDCAGAMKIFQAEFPNMPPQSLRSAFEANVPTCVGK